MTVLKVIGVLAGVSIIALIGGGFYLAYKAKKGFKTLIDEVKDRIPTNPEKRPKDGETDQPPFRPKPSGLIMDTGDVPPELKAALDELFTDFWPPSDEVIDNLTDEDVVVFAVESEPVGNYTQTWQEAISAKVLSVETNVVRARIIGPVAYAEHHGAHAGHGFRVGDLVEDSRLAPSRLQGDVAVSTTSPRTRAHSAAPRELTRNLHPQNLARHRPANPRTRAHTRFG